MSAPEPFEPLSLVGCTLTIDTLQEGGPWQGKCVALWAQGVVIEMTLAVTPLRSAPDTVPHTVSSLHYFPWVGVRISWHKPAHDAPHATATVGADGDVFSTRSEPT